MTILAYIAAFCVLCALIFAAMDPFDINDRISGE